MTKRKHLKELVRERQLETGESYTAALAHVRAQAPERTEMEDHGAIARECGLKCQVTSTGSVEDVKAALVAVRALAEASPEAKLARAVLEGRPAKLPAQDATALAVELRRFFAAARAGARGWSPSGLMAVVQAGDEPVVAMFWPGAKPLTWLALLDEVGEHFRSPWFSLAGLGGVTP